MTTTASFAPKILDGGLATELERRGCCLDDPLWSAKILLEKPLLIRQVHADYLAAGADCITTATYQATFPGLQRAGFDRRTASEIFRSSVELACLARDEWLNTAPAGEVSPLVAASIGPYGAFLHDGSEYRGDYGLSVEALADFHRERIAVLADAGADVLAFETIPSLIEAEALLSVLHEFSHATAWISFSCADARHTAHGESLADCAARLEEESRIIAVGANCFPPQWAPEVVQAFRRGGRKPILLYPNAGERWNAVDRAWEGDPHSQDFVAFMLAARAAGARCVGGCCRTTPAHIRALRDSIRAGR